MITREESRYPPKLTIGFLRIICPDHLLEEIEGQPYSAMRARCEDVRIKRTNKRFSLAFTRFVKPGIILRKKLSINMIQYDMIRSYITIAFRNFLRQKSYTLLNVVGLSLGIAASLLIIRYVKYERSFDTFHSRAEDIYRIQYKSLQIGQPNFESAVAIPAVGLALTNNIPRVEAHPRFLPSHGVEAAMTKPRRDVEI